ncbi:MAG: LamG domain-containing protein [Phycisphaerae bacterium]|nr:LamG domain-containing protein [Phycisphaerae bacterium]
MKSLKHVENLINDLNDTTSADMDKRVLRDTLRAIERSQEKTASPKANIFRKISKTRLYASAAAAVIIAGIFIGIYLFSNLRLSQGGRPLAGTPSGRGEHPGSGIGRNNKVTIEKPVRVTEAKKTPETIVRTEAARVETEKTESRLSLELASIEQMFKAGNVNGLIAMLSKGEFESKVAAANFLAKIGTLEAIEPLEKISEEYGAYNRDNPFARAVEKIASRVFAKLEESSTITEIPKADTTIVAAEKVTGPPLMNTPTRAGFMERGGLESGEPSAGLVRSFQAEAKEAADGYPVKGCGNAAVEVVPASLLQNLVFYYSFHTGEDTNTAGDISGNNLHGQVNGAKYAQDEVLGGTMAFDGQDDYISIPDIYLEGFTISVWVKAPEPGSMNNRRIFTLYDEEHCYAVEGNTRGGISVGAEKIGAKETKTTDVAGETATAETDTTASTGAADSERISSESEWSKSNWAEGAQFSDYDWRLKSNTWTHITVTFDGVTGRIYRNGKLREEGNIPAEGFTGTAYIGGIDRHNGGFWRGMIDEVALFNRALTEDEVGQLYLMTGEMIPTGPTLTEGASGNGYYFNGEGDYIDVGTITGLGAEQTKMLWINMEASPLTQEVYLIDEGGNNNWIELIDSNGNGAPEVRAGFDGENYFDSEGQILQGYWCHIAVVSKASGEIDIYINGVLDSSASGFSATNKPQAIMIGADSGTQVAGFKGIIDEVAIFNRALPDYEIKQVYQNVGRLRGNEPGLVGYWNFDADEGDIVKDSSPYHNDGKLSDI